ncbi:MAG: hypothetical protein EOO04_03975 [Chitinophagaceae bacterium]|nr:MAG: hypothetical protein EOO04_03975 [Chitinophagaceae bacterium]
MTQRKDDIIFSAAPDFARFIYNNHLAEYIRYEIRTSRNMNIPLWEKYSDISDEDLIAGSSKYFADFLLSVAENRTSQNLADGLKNYREDLMLHVTRDQLTSEDLLLTHAARRRTLFHFLERYTQDPNLILQIVRELEIIFTNFGVSSTNTYVEILNKRVEEEKSINEKLFNTSPGFFYLYDLANSRQVVPAERLFKYLGYSRYDYVGHSAFIHEILHPDDKIRAIDYVASLHNIMEGEVRFFEYRLKNVHGEYLWLRSYESVFKWTPGNKPSQLLGVAFDITQERFFGEQIRLKEEELFEAQRIAKIGAYTWDLQNNIVSSYSGTLENLGLKSGESFNEVMSHVHPSDKRLVMEAFGKAIDGKREYEIEYRCTVNGRERMLWSKGKVIHEDGKPRFFRATVMDVTEQQQMLGKLRRSEELYKQAQALNRIGNWSWDLHSDRVQWSDELFNIFDLPTQSEQITVDRYLSFIHPDDRQIRANKLAEQLRNPVHNAYYLRIITAAGNEKILYGQSEVLLDETGKPYKMIGTCQDVTAQKTLEKTLYDRTIQLQKSNASLNVFSYISSHDLKEPLRKISLFGDRLRMLNKDKLDEQSKNILNTMIQSSLRLQQMIDEILSVSRINSDEHFTTTSLQGILEDVLNILEPEIGEKNAIVRYDPLPEIYANPIQMQQLFNNLLSNSLKFARPGVAPVITITCDYPEPAELSEMGLDDIVRHLRIRFADNGIGFQKEYAEKIFAIFQRLHDKSAYKGSGIGLAICREIVAHHGGLITADGVLHEGAVFTIVIPLSPGVV